MNINGFKLKDGSIAKYDYASLVNQPTKLSEFENDSNFPATEVVETMIGDAVKGGVHPNLLDNTDLSNPVNQKGATTYSGTGYGIDRWTGMSRTVVELVPGGVQLSNSNPEAGFAYWQQLIEPERLDFGNQPYSIGVKINGTLYYASGTGALSVSTNANINIIFQAVSSGHIAFRITLPAGYTGQVVVSEPALYKGRFTDKDFPLFTRPNYAEELAKCQRYFYAIRTTGNNMLATAIANTTTNLLFAMPLPVPMRANPAASYSNLLYSTAGGAAGVAPSSVSPISTINNETAIRTLMLGGSFTTGTPYALIVTDGGHLYLDANL